MPSGKRGHQKNLTKKKYAMRGNFSTVQQHLAKGYNLAAEVEGGLMVESLCVPRDVKNQVAMIRGEV